MKNLYLNNTLAFLKIIVKKEAAVQDVKRKYEGKNKYQIRRPLLLKPACPTPSNTRPFRPLHGDAEMGTKVCGTEKFCNDEA